jgi:hypothetical protein
MASEEAQPWVKFIFGLSEEELQDAVNNFIIDHDIQIIDVKFSVANIPVENDKTGACYYRGSAMIIYKRNDE